jgi:predicted RND superfamily exporter protein
MMDRLLSFLITRRGWLAGIVVAFSLVAMVSVSRLTFEDQPRELFHRKNEDMTQLNQFFHDFGPDDNELILVVDGQSLFRPDAIAAIWQLHAQLRRLEYLSSSRSLVDVRKRGSRILPLLPRYEVSQDDCDEALREAMRNPIVAGQFLSRDATTLLFLMELKSDIIAMTEVEKCLADVQRIAKSILEPVGLRTRLAGHPAIRVDLINNTRQERVRFVWISGAVSAVLAWVLFRSFAAMVVCVGGPAIGVLWTMGILAATNGRLNVLGAAVPALIFVIGFTD